jgi:hypothetical protein
MKQTAPTDVTIDPPSRETCRDATGIDLVVSVHIAAAAAVVVGAAVAQNPMHTRQTGERR